MPLEHCNTLVQNARRIAVMHCPCRHYANLLGNGCGRPVEACFAFDDVADHMVEYERAREVSKQEAMKILRHCEEEGLVHQMFLDREHPNDANAMCNCCQ